MLNRFVHLCALASVTTAAISASSISALANPAATTAIEPASAKTAILSSNKTIVINTNITEAEVLAVQQAWGDALVAISTTHEQKVNQQQRLWRKR